MGRFRLSRQNDQRMHSVVILNDIEARTTRTDSTDCGRAVLLARVVPRASQVLLGHFWPGGRAETPPAGSVVLLNRVQSTAAAKKRLAQFATSTYHDNLISQRLAPRRLRQRIALPTLPVTTSVRRMSRTTPQQIESTGGKVG